MRAFHKTTGLCALGTVTVIGLSACQTTQPLSEPVQARLVKSTSANTAVLSKAVSEALGGRKVTLAPNVLMDKSTLVMDPKFVDDRSFQRPDHFRLMTNGQSCYLVHEESGKSMPLKGMDCQAL